MTHAPFNLQRVLARAADVFADNVAVSVGGATLTYARLAERASRLARALRRMGLEKGDRVALLSRNSFRCLEVNLACVEAGLILVPLNFRLSEHEIGLILARSGSRLLLRALPYGGPLRSLAWDDDDPIDGASAYEAALRDAGASQDASTVVASADDDIAQIFFTSGTTGVPKGVCLTHRNLIASALDSVICMELRERDAWLHASPMFHLVDAFAIWAITLVGARHVFAHFTADQFARVVEAERITKSSMPPTLLDMIAKSDATRLHDVSSLELMSYGGSPMPRPVYARVKEALGCSLLQAYGVTEVGGLVCHQLMGEETPAGETYVNSAGRPAIHVDLRIVDDAGTPLEAGETGEIVVRGPRVMTGYWNDAEATARAIPDGWYRSGDLGMADPRGAVTIMGRKKDMIITGGENVYPAEVEEALLAHPEVVEAAVFGAPSETWGEEVWGVVHVRAGSTLDEAGLKAHCRTLIGGYKVPKRIHIEDRELPKSGPGKIAKSTVRAKFLGAAA